MALSDEDRELALAEYRKFFGVGQLRRFTGAVSAEQINQIDYYSELASLHAYELGMQAAYAKAAQLCDKFGSKAMDDCASPEWASEEAAKEIRARAKGESK